MSLITKLFGEKKHKPQIPQTKNIRELIPVKEIRRGIVLTNETAIKFLEILPVNFTLKSEREQNFIINRYEELLKVVKAPFYVFTIAKKADSKAHIDYISMLYDKESNENVKQMIIEYRDNLQEVSYQNAVRRRFIVAFPYQIPPGLSFKSLPFPEIESWLTIKCNQFKDAITRCGNEVFMPDDEDKFTAHILFELLNVKSSEKERMVSLHVN